MPFVSSPLAFGAQWFTRSTVSPSRSGVYHGFLMNVGSPGPPTQNGTTRWGLAGPRYSFTANTNSFG